MLLLRTFRQGCRKDLSMVMIEWKKINPSFIVFCLASGVGEITGPYLKRPGQDLLAPKVFVAIIDQLERKMTPWYAIGTALCESGFNLPEPLYTPFYRCFIGKEQGIESGIKEQSILLYLCYCLSKCRIIYNSKFRGPLWGQISK